MPLSFLLRRGLQVAFSGALALAPLLAQNPSPAAVLQGRLRSFSPKGRFAVVQDGTRLKVYETATWKASEGLETEGAPWEAFGAILVDDAARVAAARAEELRVFDFSGAPRCLITLPHSPTFLALPRMAEEGLLVKILSVPPKPTGERVQSFTKVRFVLKYKSSLRVYKYDIVPFSVRLADLLDVRTRVGGTGVPGAAEVETLRQVAVPGAKEEPLGFRFNEAPTDQGSRGSLRLLQLRDDFARVRAKGWRLWVHSSSPGSADDATDWVWDLYPPLYEVKAPGVDFENERRPQKGEDEAMVPQVPRVFRLRDCDVWRWGRVIPKGPDTLGSFEPRFKPATNSADGRWLGAEPVAVAGGGWTTAVYASETVADPFAGYAPDVLQDLLLGKIIGFIKGKQPASALPYFRRLEQTGVAQPQSFFYYRMKALEEVGRKQEARAEAETYLKRHGKKGEFYEEVIALLNRLG